MCVAWDTRYQHYFCLQLSASEHKASSLLLLLNIVCICVCMFSRVSGVWPFTFRMVLRRAVMPLGQWNRRWAAVPVPPAPLSRCHWDSHRTSITSRHRLIAAPRVTATLTPSLVSAHYYPFPPHTRSYTDKCSDIRSIFYHCGDVDLLEGGKAWGKKQCGK